MTGGGIPILDFISYLPMLGVLALLGVGLIQFFRGRATLWAMAALATIAGNVGLIVEYFLPTRGAVEFWYLPPLAAVVAPVVLSCLVYRRKYAISVPRVLGGAGVAVVAAFVLFWNATLELMPSRQVEGIKVDVVLPNPSLERP